MCETRTVKNTRPERELTAFLLFSMLSACTQHDIKRVLRVTKLLNLPDEVKDTIHCHMAVRSSRYLPAERTPTGHK